MFILFFSKSLCILSFYFLTASLIFSIEENAVAFTLFSLLLIVYLTCYLFEKLIIKFNKPQLNFLKYLPILLVLFSLTIGDLMHFAFMILPSVYIFITILKNSFDVEHFTFKSLFLKLTIVIFVMLFFLALSGPFDQFLSFAMPYICIFFLSGINTLRVSRHSLEIINQRRFVIINFTFLITSFLICIAIGSQTAVNIFIEILSFIGRTLILPIFMAIIYIATGIAYILYYLFIRFIKVTPLEQAQEATDEAFGVAEQMLEATGYTDQSSLKYILAWSIVAIVLFFLLKMFLKRGKSQAKGEAEGVLQKTTFLQNSTPKNRGKLFSTTGNREKIRKKYKKILRFFTASGIDIKPSDNSASVHLKATSLLEHEPTSLKKVKELYRLARYSEHHISPQDLKVMDSSCKDIEEQFKK